MTEGPLAAASDCYTEIDSAYSAFDARSLVSATTPGDVDRIRQELIGYIWKAPTLPAGLPEVSTYVLNPFPELQGLPILGHVDRLSVTIGEFTSNMYLLVPGRSRRQLVIFHQGHASGLAPGNGTDVVHRALERRQAVLVVHMPLFGPNLAPFGPVPFFHDPMFIYRTAELNPLVHFLEPVVRAITYAQHVLGIRRVDMIGISGGGWTTTLAAAVDPRIRVSVPVAGSLPRYLRTPPCATPGDVGDYEQYEPGLFSMVDYLDLYVLGAYGRGRAQLQVLNQYDTCCFSGVRYRTYSEMLKGLVHGLHGRYDVFLDSSHHGHQISPHALDTAILPFLRRRRL